MKGGRKYHSTSTKHLPQLALAQKLSATCQQCNAACTTSPVRWCQQGRGSDAHSTHSLPQHDAHFSSDVQFMLGPTAARQNQCFGLESDRPLIWVAWLWLELQLAELARHLLPRAPKRVVVVGGGPTGLFCADRLRHHFQARLVAR